MQPSSSKPVLLPREPGYPRECELCAPRPEFYDQADFGRHIRMAHSSKEGGSYVCRYGPNNVCQKLPPEGVSDVDFEAHIRKFHTSPNPVAPRLSNADRAYTKHSFTQNLSSVLTDPSRSRSDVNTFFTRHWGDSFVVQDVPKCTHLPPVDVNMFAKYMKSTGKTYKKYTHARDALKRLDSRNDDRSETDDLPTIFLDKSFALNEGDTFASVFTVPQAGACDTLSVTVRTSRPSTEKNDATCLGKNSGEFRNYDALQSRLEAMHDVVDSRLANKLVTKKDAFWQIVNSYGSLHQELADALGQIKAVRSNLQRVSTLTCERTERVIKLYEMREKKEKLLSKLKDIACLRAAQSTVQMLLSQGEYPRALECIETSQEVLSSELNGVVCFRHLSSQLSELREVIGRMMREDFATLIQKEFGIKADESGQIIHEGELASVIAGLIQMQKFTFTIVLRGEIAESIKNILRQTVKQRIVTSAMDLALFDPSLQNLGDSVRRLKFAEWLHVLDDVMDALYLFNLRIQTLQEMILELCDRMDSKSGDSREREISPNTSAIPLVIPDVSTNSSDADEFTGINNSGTLGAVVDAGAMLAIELRTTSQLRHAIGALAQYTNQCAQLRVCRLLQARSKETINDTAAPSPSELSLVLSAMKGFQMKCAARGWTKSLSESARGGGSGPLQTCSHKLTIDFIDRFHRQKRNKIGEVLDQEQWKATDVPYVFQKMASECDENGVLRTVDDGENRDTQTSLRVSENNYVIVGSVLILIRVLAEYCECVNILPNFASDILIRVIELLKAFNSRSCQLILGAGALQLVGLKTISVRNLALSSRSLQLVVHYIPIIQRELDSYMTDENRHQLRHFKQVMSDYSDHVNEITAKLVSVIDHNILNSLESWKIKGSIPSDSFSAICRNLLKFHNGMSGIMPDEQIMLLFGAVHTQFKDHLKLKLAQMKVSPHDSLTWGIVSQDYAFYTNSVKSMVSCKEMQFESLNEVIYGK